MFLLDKLLSERKDGCKGGIYNKLQVDFAYNSNHIEGSRLTHDQTRYIFETKSVGTEDKNSALRVNDIIETVNHFRCFDLILDTVEEELTEDYIKTLHRMLKSGIMDRTAVIGEYKSEPNEVGGIETVRPEKVSQSVKALLSDFNGRRLGLYDIALFHKRYESIHPFYDGNGRTGRLIMFKQCLQNSVLPFIIDDNDKMFYYMGLKEWQENDSDERLINVFLAAQDNMERVLDYFEINYTREEKSYKEVQKK